MRIHKGDQKAVAKPLCLCATCAALTNKSLEDTLNSAPAKLRQQSAKLVVHLCRQVLSSSLVGLRFDRNHAFFGKTDPLNACKGGAFLPTVRKVFRELGLHVTVFPSLHASLFESYYVSLPNDGPALDQVKAAAARLAGRWHSLALGYTPKELAWHVEQRDRQHRGRIADVVAAEDGSDAAAELSLAFLAQAPTLVPRFKYIYEYDYELSEAVGRRTNPRYYGDLVLTDGCGVFMTVETAYLDRRLRRYSGPTSPQGLRNASPVAKSRSGSRASTPSRRSVSTPDWAAALAALADEAGGDPLRSSICSAGLASSVGSGVSASSVGGFGRQRLLPTEVRDQADRVAQLYAASHSEAIAVVAASYTDEGFAFLNPDVARIYTDLDAYLQRQPSPPASPVLPPPPSPSDVSPLPLSLLHSASSKTPARMRPAASRQMAAAKPRRRWFRRIFGLALLAGAGAVGVQVARGELTLDDVQPALKEAKARAQSALRATEAATRPARQKTGEWARQGARIVQTRVQQGVSAAKGVASAIGRKLQERKAGSSATNTKPAAAGKAGAKAQDMSTFVSNGPYPFGRK